MRFALCLQPLDVLRPLGLHGWEHANLLSFMMVSPQRHRDHRCACVSTSIGLGLLNFNFHLNFKQLSCQWVERGFIL